MPTLPVPFYRQKTETHCGIAALEMILGYKTHVHDQDRLNALVVGAIQRASQSINQGGFGAHLNPSEGLPAPSMGDLLALVGVSTFQATYPDAKLEFQTIVDAINGRSPILVYLQHGAKGPYGHYLVIIGYGYDQQSGGRPFIELHDPAGEPSKLVYYDQFPGSYFTSGDWIWGEAWVLSWV